MKKLALVLAFSFLAAQATHFRFVTFFDITNHGLLITRLGDKMSESLSKYKISKSNTDAENNFAKQTGQVAWLFEGCYKYEVYQSASDLIKALNQNNRASFVRNFKDLTSQYFSTVLSLYDRVAKLEANANAENFSLNFEEIRVAFGKASHNYQTAITLLTSVQGPFKLKENQRLDGDISIMTRTLAEGLQASAYAVCASSFDEKSCTNIESDSTYPRVSTVAAFEGLAGAYSNFFDKWQGEWGLKAEERSCERYLNSVDQTREAISNEIGYIADQVRTGGDVIGEGMEEHERKALDDLITDFSLSWAKTADGQPLVEFARIEKKACIQLFGVSPDQTFTTCGCNHL